MNVDLNAKLDAQFRSMADDSPVLLWMCNESGLCTFFNKTWLNFTGRSMDEELGVGWADNVHFEDFQHCMDTFVTSFNKRESFEMEYRLQRADGEYRWVLDRGNPRYDAEDKFCGYVGSCVDITEKRMLSESHEKLRQQLERDVYRKTYQLKEAQRIAQLGDWTFNVDKRELEWGDTFFEICDLPADNRFSSLEQAVELIYEDDRSKFTSRLRDAVRYKQFESLEFRVRLPDGNFRTIHCRGEVVTNAQGDVIRIVGTAQDISEIKKIQSELELAQEKAVLASNLKSRFLANMSHEIRTPLNGIIAMCSLMEETELNPEQREFLSTMHSSSSVLLSLVNDILDFSKIEAGKLEFARKEFDLVQLNNDVILTASYALREKGLRFNTDCRLGDSLPVIGDPVRIREVLGNLLSNATKFTRKGSVTLQCRIENEDEDRCTIYYEIADTGIGIPKNIQRHLFSAFQQGDLSSTKQFEGTGLGLSISKHLVEMMGGTIGVRSKVNIGSVFDFTIQLDKTSGAVAQPRDNAESEQEESHIMQKRLNGTRSILFVEDNEINQMVCRKFLERLGVDDVAIATNGRDAIDKLKQHKDFDLILMDCQMPVMDGYEATRIIRSSKDLDIKDIPIVAMTANAFADDRTKCLECGMNDYIAKPFRIDDLATVLDRWTRTDTGV